MPLHVSSTFKFWNFVVFILQNAGYRHQFKNKEQFLSMFFIIMEFVLDFM